MAPASLEPDEPDFSGQGGVPLEPRDRDRDSSSPPQAAAHGRAPDEGAVTAQARRYAVVQAYDGDGMPVDPDPDWQSGRWDDSAEAAQYWAELEASLTASQEKPCADPLNGLLPREYFDDESCDRPTDAEHPE